MSTAYDQVIPSPRFDKDLSNLTCEAYDCNKPATKQKTLSVGTFGDVTLNLCKDCLSKFNGGVVTKNGSEDHSLSSSEKLADQNVLPRSS